MAAWDGAYPYFDPAFNGLLTVFRLIGLEFETSFALLSMAPVFFIFISCLKISRNFLISITITFAYFVTYTIGPTRQVLASSIVFYFISFYGVKLKYFVLGSFFHWTQIFGYSSFVNLRIKPILLLFLVSAVLFFTLYVLLGDFLLVRLGNLSNSKPALPVSALAYKASVIGWFSILWLAHKKRNANFFISRGVFVSVLSGISFLAVLYNNDIGQRISMIFDIGLFYWVCKTFRWVNCGAWFKILLVFAFCFKGIAALANL